MATRTRVESRMLKLISSCMMWLPHPPAISAILSQNMLVKKSNCDRMLRGDNVPVDTSRENAAESTGDCESEFSEFGVVPDGEGGGSCFG